MRRLPGFGENGASVSGAGQASGRDLRGRASLPGFNPSNRIRATNFRHISAFPNIMLRCSNYKGDGSPQQ